MARRRPLRSVLAALLLTPALLAGAADGCDCGSGPRLPETEALTGCGPDENEPNERDLTDSKQKMARELGYSVQQIRRAIHAVKRKASVDGNADVKVDIRTGEVYPLRPNGKIGDSVGNILDHLP